MRALLSRDLPPNLTAKATAAAAAVTVVTAQPAIPAGAGWGLGCN